MSPMSRPPGIPSRMLAITVRRAWMNTLATGDSYGAAKVGNAQELLSPPKKRLVSNHWPQVKATKPSIGT